MRRAFTTREKVLLVILAVLIIGVGYFKLILEPINDSIANYQSMTSAEQDEMVTNTVLLTKMNQMRKELETIYASGEQEALPAYNNTEQLLVELRTVLLPAQKYSLNFGAESVLEGGYIVSRPLSLTFTGESYEQTRSILDALHESKNVNQMSDFSVRFTQEGAVEVSLIITYFELMD